MSISPALRALARSAYRELFRASASTFFGDAVVLPAFRSKIRADALRGNGITDADVYEERVKLAREMAAFLRNNVVQGRKVHADDATSETWKLTFTKDTELGDNESIKYPEPIISGRRMRKQQKCAMTTFDAAEQQSNAPRYYSALKKAHRERQVPKLNEEDIKESFVFGGGPGGQSVNKTKNNVQLLHKPTGIRVTNQETRSLAVNRQLARRILIDKLDKIQNPGLSRREFKQAKQRERERRRRKRARKRDASKAHGN